MFNIGDVLETGFKIELDIVRCLRLPDATEISVAFKCPQPAHDEVGCLRDRLAYGE